MTVSKINDERGTDGGWSTDADLQIASSGVDGEAVIIRPDTSLVQVVDCGTLAACTLQPRYSRDGGTTWLSMDSDIEGRTYPETVDVDTRPKLPKTFILAGSKEATILFNCYSSVAQASKDITAQQRV